MNEIKNAIVIKVGDRYFHNYKNKRITTAWCLAGAKLFRPSDMDSVIKIETILKNKKYKFERVLVQVKS